MKKPIAIILAAIMMFALCACGNTATDSSDSGPTYVFTFGTVDTDEHPSTMSAKKLGEILNEKAPGKWQINIHPMIRLMLMFTRKAIDTFRAATKVLNFAYKEHR